MGIPGSKEERGWEGEEVGWLVGWLVIPPPKPKYTHPYKSRFGASVHCGTGTGTGARHLASEYLVSGI